MNTQILTGEDTRFLAQQPEYEVNIMVGQMTTLMQNITDLQNDTDDKVAQLQNQGWFKRMTNTLFGLLIKVKRPSGTFTKFSQKKK